jgi:hypothetical protein
VVLVAVVVSVVESQVELFKLRVLEIVGGVQRNDGDHGVNDRLGVIFILGIETSFKHRTVILNIQQWIYSMS